MVGCGCRQSLNGVQGGREFKSRRPDGATESPTRSYAVGLSRLRSRLLRPCYVRHQEPPDYAPAVAWAGSAFRIFVAVVTTRRIVLLSGSV